MSIGQRFAELGMNIPQILLPEAHVDLAKWAVIACDQFSSERSYWEETRRFVGTEPSTLNLIIPECYLEDGDRDQRVSQSNATMVDYVERGVLEAQKPGFLLVDRSTPLASSRMGLVLAVDLESYDYEKGSSSLIRPTEGTIKDRLPPRMAVRRGAKLDLPHVLLLIDDPDDLVMTAATQCAEEKAYDFELMQSGGRISARVLPSDALGPIAAAFEALAARSDLLFAVGDGNHSLAAAKEIWNEKKAEGVPDDHPSRYALVEVENIHDPGLVFHPIHRVMFDVDAELWASRLAEVLGAERQARQGSVHEHDLLDLKTGQVKVGLVFPEGEEILTFSVDADRLAVEPLQDGLDALLAEHPEADIDYIHGDESVRSLVGEDTKRLGLILPPLDKHHFFTRITSVGPYPRKTFSIGEAVEKRYYLESRLLG